jgi:hypothetical protein
MELALPPVLICNDVIDVECPGVERLGQSTILAESLGSLSNAPVEVARNGHGISESLPGVPEDLSGSRLKDTEESSDTDIFVEIVLLAWSQSALLRLL